MPEFQSSGTKNSESFNSQDTSDTFLCGIGSTNTSRLIQDLTVCPSSMCKMLIHVDDNYILPLIDIMPSEKYKTSNIVLLPGENICIEFDTVVTATIVITYREL